MPILLTMMDDKGNAVDVDIDLDAFLPNAKGEYLNNDEDGLAVVNAVANALKELREQQES